MTLSQNNKISQQENDIIDLGRLFGEIIDHRKLILSITAAVTLLAILYVSLSTPIYQANALVQVEQKQGNAILNGLSQILPSTQPQSAPEITLLQSRMILGKTVDDMDLQYSVKPKSIPFIGEGIDRIWGEGKGEIHIKHLYIPMRNGENVASFVLTVKNKSTYEIKKDDVEAEGNVGTTLEVGGISLLVDAITAREGSQFVVNYKTRLKAISDLQDALSISEQGKDTGMLELTLIGANPTLIRNTLDGITQNYLEQNVARQAAQDAKSLDFLNKQLPKVRDELDIAESKLNTYRKQKDSVDLSMEAKTVLDQIVNVDNQLNELTFREAEISQLYTKEHPTYKALMEKKQTLQEEKSKLGKRVSSMPATQQEVLRLSRDVESGRAVYLQLLNRQQELNIAKSSAIGNVRVIDNAVTDPEPVKPKKVLIIVGAVTIGLILSIILVLLKVFLRRGIESPEQLEELGINVYASIPVSEWLTNKTSKTNKKKNESEILLIDENPADLAVEAIRSLRTSLHFAMMESKNNVLMISGASPNAGKTFVSTNLAATIASAGKRVLFIDADLRKGDVHKIFKNNHEKGLSDILSGLIEVKSSIEKVPNGAFDFISRGQVPPNPSELLMHPRFEALLKWASQEYDLVIIDTPPILAVTDAAIIGRYVGTTLLVARYEANTAKEILISKRRFEQSGIEIKGCILNGVVKKASSYYGYGYNHYGYSYGEHPKK
ncbi:TPA: polysaccharide biosynthesis tyrosine autokinase [Klebsiella pneumoniae]